ncbi:MAG: EAL domain-containing protein [Leptothrix sp. (in: b-proteobacteria)]
MNASLAVGGLSLATAALALAYLAQPPSGAPGPLPLGAALLVASTALVCAVAVNVHRRWRHLRRTQQRLAGVFADASVGIGVIALDGRLIEVNRRFASLLGQPPEVLCRMTFADLLDPDDLAHSRASRRALLKGEVAEVRLERRYRRPDGSSIWAELTVSVHRDARGLAQHFIALVHDIGPLCDARDELQHQQRQLQQVIDGISDPVSVRDLSGRYLLLNPAAAATLGRPADAVLGRHVDDMYPAELAAQIRADAAAAVRQRGAIRREWQVSAASSAPGTPAPMLFDLSISPLFGLDGEIQGVISVGRDITLERHNRALLEQTLQRNADLLVGADRARLALLSLLEDQQRDQRALADSEARLRAVVAALPDLIFLFDDSGRVIDAWASQPDKLLVPRDRLIGQRLQDYLPPALARLMSHHLAAVIGGAGSQVFEYEVPIDAVDHAFEMRMARAGEREVLAIARDVTAERRAREALERSENSLRLALEGSGDGLWDWDLVSGLLRFGGAMHTLMGHPGDTLDADFQLRERLHPQDRDEVIAQFRAARLNGKPFSLTTRLRRFDGEYRWFSARGSVHFDTSGRALRMSGVVTDLTDRLRAEERQRLAAQVFDSTQEGVMITDAQHRIISVNRAFTTLLGYTEDEVRGHSPALLGSSRHDLAFHQAISAQLEASGHWQGEIWNQRKDGTLLPELLSISAVRNPQDQVTHYVGVFTDITHLKNSEAQLEYLAHHDPLTGLPNRLLFHNRLNQALLQAQRSGQRLAVLLLDLDRFKDINDSYGHLAGDELLQHVARRLTLRLRQTDTLARLGGDEFAVLMNDLRYDDDAARLASELIQAMSDSWRSSDGVEVSIGVSIGICLYPDHGQTSQALLQGADAALYRSKGDGRGVYRYYADEMTRAARERLHLEAKLRRALTENQFVLHYQPQVDLQSGQVIGAEALVRWNDPELGLIAPTRFIPVAEATGLIADIGSWVLREACRQGRAWLDAGLAPLQIAVNVSARQFHHVDLAAQVMQVLAETGLPPGQLELELTEGALMEREGEALAMLQRLRALGVRIAIDDFGTGYSSLAYLKRFPIDVLKIDRGFIADIPTDPDDMEIASAIIAMGHSLGIQVLAEGVETVDQLAFLRLKRCDRYQGYLRGRPMPAADFTALFTTPD